MKTISLSFIYKMINIRVLYVAIYHNQRLNSVKIKISSMNLYNIQHIMGKSSRHS